MDRIKDFIRPMELDRIDKLLKPIAMNAIASIGFPASSPQKFIGVSFNFAFCINSSRKLR